MHQRIVHTVRDLLRFIDFKRPIVRMAFMIFDRHQGNPACKTKPRAYFMDLIAMLVLNAIQIISVENVSIDKLSSAKS